MSRQSMLINCTQCNKEHEACRKTQRFCSQKCAMVYRCANGFIANTEAAHQALRTKGHYKRDNTYLTARNPAAQAGIGNKISKAKTGVAIPKLQGENHPQWKGGVDKSVWKSQPYQAWRKAVMRRDNYTCQFCGDNRGGNLEADHIKPRYLYPELTFDLDNGRTLCKPCHKQTPTWGHKVKKLVRL